MGITGAEVKEQLSGVYNPTLKEMAKVFAKSKDTLSLYGSGAIISQVLKAKGQITTIPRTEDTYDDSFVKAMLKK